MLTDKLRRIATYAVVGAAALYLTSKLVTCHTELEDDLDQTAFCNIHGYLKGETNEFIEQVARREFQDREGHPSNWDRFYKSFVASVERCD